MMLEMAKSSIVKEFAIPAFALVLFFLLQARGSMTEGELTFFLVGVSSLLFYWSSRLDEAYLFGVGTVAGLIIEVGFRYLGYQQVWTDASLFGVPVWLPIAWGMGFVLITRLGIYMRGIRFND